MHIIELTKKWRNIMKFVLNKGVSGFDMSNEVYEYLIDKKGWKAVKLPEKDEDFDKVDADIFILNDDEYDFAAPNTNSIGFRTNPDLVEAVEQLGSQAFSEYGGCPVVIDIEEDIEDPVIMETSDGIEFLVDCKYLIG